MTEDVLEVICSFCRGQRQSRTAVAGPTVFICDACIAVCRGLLRNPPAPLEGERNCSFCGQSSKAVEHVIVPAHGSLGICNECVGLCEEILPEILAKQK